MLICRCICHRGVEDDGGISKKVGFFYEGLSLLEFRSRVESDPYGALQNWNPSDDDPCNWTGVHCADGKVVTL